MRGDGRPGRGPLWASALWASHRCSPGVSLWPAPGSQRVGPDAVTRGRTGRVGAGPPVGGRDVSGRKKGGGGKKLNGEPGPQGATRGAAEARGGSRAVEGLGLPPSFFFTPGTLGMGVGVGWGGGPTLALRLDRARVRVTRGASEAGVEVTKKKVGIPTKKGAKNGQPGTPTPYHLLSVFLSFLLLFPAFTTQE